MNTEKLLEIKKKLEQDIKRLLAPEGYLYAGLPHFKRLFGRDSIISSLQLLDYDPDIARSTLKILADLQGQKLDKKSEQEPGKILHEHWVGLPFPRRFTDLRLLWLWKFPYFGSIDSTPLFCILAWRYFKKTKDTAFLSSLGSNISAALSWMIKYGDKDGDLYIEYERKNPYGLLHQGWKDGLGFRGTNAAPSELKPPIALVEVQGYAFAAMHGAVELSQALNLTLPYELKDLVNRTERLKEKFLFDFWLEDEKFFAFALDREKKPVADITSNPGHLLFTGILDGQAEKEKALVERLFKPDLWTPFGIRTLSSLSPYFDERSYHLGSVWPHDNWMIWLGLKERGFEKEAQRIEEALFAAYENIGHIPEFYSVNKEGQITASYQKPAYPQAWASAALLSIVNSNLTQNESSAFDS